MELQTLIDGIHEASVVPDLWPEFLRNFARFCDAREAAFVAYSTSQVRLLGSSPAVEGLSAGIYAYEGGHERSRRLMQAMSENRFLTEFDLFTEEEIANNDAFINYLLPNGYGRGLATTFDTVQGDRLFLHSEGDLSLGRLPPELIARVDLLRPQLVQASTISARMLFERAQTAVTVLGALGLAACAVRRNRSVLTANPLFDTAQDYWTSGAFGRLTLLDRRADLQLDETLQRIERGVTAAPIGLSRSAERGPAVIHSVPVRGAANDLFSGSIVIFVLIRASDAKTFDRLLLSRFFDLTPTESSIAARLASGLSLREIAEIDGKSFETLRNQVKPVLMKTGCRRQADLIGLIHRLMPFDQPGALRR